MQNSYCNKQLLSKIQKNSSFKKLMNDNQIYYLQKQQQAIYTDLSKVTKDFIQIRTQNGLNNIKSQQKQQNKNLKTIVLVYSHYQPTVIQQFYKLYLQFISTFPQPKCPFYLIYINSQNQISRNQSWSTFKTSILQQLPLKYFLFLQKIFIIRPSFLDKASSIIQFDTLSRFLKEKCLYSQNLQEAAMQINISYKQLKNLLPQTVKVEQNGSKLVNAFIPLICNPDSNRTSINENSKLQQSSSYKQRHIKIFKKQHRQKKAISRYLTGELGIPLIFQLLLYYFTSQPKRCIIEGIFRKASSIDDDQYLINELQKQNYDILNSYNQSLAVASVTKKFFTNLQFPLIPYETHLRIIQKHDSQNLKQQIQKIPMINYMTLLHFIKFFKNYIIPYEKYNMMSIHNISICLAPCIMRFKQINSNQFKYASTNISITKILIQKFNQIFGNKQDQNKICKKTNKIYRESLLLLKNQKQLYCPAQLLDPASTILAPIFSQDGSQILSEVNKSNKSKKSKNAQQHQPIEQQNHHQSQNLLAINDNVPIRKKHRSWYKNQLPQKNIDNEIKLNQINYSIKSNLNLNKFEDAKQHQKQQSTLQKVKSIKSRIGFNYVNK